MASQVEISQNNSRGLNGKSKVDVKRDAVRQILISLINREYTSPMTIPLYTPMTGLTAVPMGHSNATNGLFGIFAQWKPFCCI